VSAFIYWWQHLPSQLNPIFLQLGPIQIRYYGLMFMMSIIMTYGVAVLRLKRESYGFTREHIDDFIFYGAVGMFLGGRLGYVLFYHFSYFLENPLEIFLPFSFQNGFHFTGIGGMSFHGGLIGVLIAIFLFVKRRQLSFWRLADYMVIGVPAGHIFGRLGNFLNGELYGRATSAAWGMYFPKDLAHVLRHPSQLYAACFEGLFIFMIMWALRNRNSYDGFLLGFYLVLYGLVRFVVEFAREPDAHLGFVVGSFSMGQALCVGMLVIGLFILVVRSRSAQTTTL